MVDTVPIHGSMRFVISMLTDPETLSTAFLAYLEEHTNLSREQIFQVLDAQDMFWTIWLQSVGMPVPWQENGG